MTMFIELVNGLPVGNPIVEENMRYLLPDFVELPSIVTPGFIEPYGYGIYEWTAQPDPGQYKKAVEITPVKGLNGIYYQTWDTIEMTPEDAAKYEEEQQNSIRSRRNRLLMESDWTQLNNAPLTPEKVEEWNQYRQTLRAIPSQFAFPTGVVWPIPPSDTGATNDPNFPAST